MDKKYQQNFKNTFTGGSRVAEGCFWPSDGATSVIRDLDKSESTGLVAEAASSSAYLVWTLGSRGGVFSALEEGFREPKMDLLGFVEMDLGRRFRSDEVEMFPKNRDSVVLAGLLFLVLIVLRSMDQASTRERERKRCTEFEFENV